MAVLFKFVLTLIRWSWKALTFIKDLIFNTLALIVILLGVTLYSVFSDTRSTQPQDGVLLFNLTGIVVDEPRDSNLLREVTNEVLGASDKLKENALFDVVDMLRQAKDDPNIKGIVLSLGGFAGANTPSLEYIGKALEEFKNSGKPIYAMGRNYSQSQYYLASFADSIYLTPQGSVGLIGLSTNNLYYKSLLDKLKVSTHVFRVGTYKSAVEPYIRDNMSPEAKSNAQRWLNEMWRIYLDKVSTNRKKSAQDLMPSIDTYISRLKQVNGDSSVYAMQYGLVDEVISQQSFISKMQKQFGSRKNSYKSVSMYDYLPTEPVASNQQIGVVFVNGTISASPRSQGIASANAIVKQLREARFDQHIKSVVLRVNSPGGGVDASEAIRSEVAALVKAGKPVVVSMSGLAASGGYWVSTPANYIIASPSTLTGSIGIFGLLNTFENSLDSIGVYSDGVTTSPLAAANVTSKLDPKVAQIFQISVENGYHNFLYLVAQSRNKTTAEIDKIAQGQVWLGTDALKNGLVDQLGDFDDAVIKAAELANLPEGSYQISWFITQPSLRDLFMGGSDSVSIKQIMMQYLPEPLAESLFSIRAQQQSIKMINDPNQQYVYCLECGYQN